MNYNRVIIAGNMTRDPELRHLPSGAALCGFTLALNRKWKTESGEDREEVAFVDVTAWAKWAEVIAQYCRKGDSILVEGRLAQDTWEDKETGQKRSKLKVVLDTFCFAGGKRKDVDAAAPPPRQKAAATAGAAPDPGDDDEVPF